MKKLFFAALFFNSINLFAKESLEKDGYVILESEQRGIFKRDFDKKIKVNINPRADENIQLGGEKSSYQEFIDKKVPRLPYQQEGGWIILPNMHIEAEEKAIKEKLEQGMVEKIPTPSLKQAFKEEVIKKPNSLANGEIIKAAHEEEHKSEPNSRSFTTSSGDLPGEFSASAMGEGLQIEVVKLQEKVLRTEGEGRQVADLSQEEFKRYMLSKKSVGEGGSEQSLSKIDLSEKGESVASKVKNTQEEVPEKKKIGSGLAKVKEKELKRVQSERQSVFFKNEPLYSKRPTQESKEKGEEWKKRYF